MNVKLRYLSGLPRHKCFDNGQFNPVTDRTTCQRSLFQAYEFAMNFRTSRAVTSPDMVVSKQGNCHWDYEPVWSKKIHPKQVNISIISTLQTNE